MAKQQTTERPPAQASLEDDPTDRALAKIIEDTLKTLDARLQKILSNEQKKLDAQA